MINQDKIYSIGYNFCALMTMILMQINSSHGTRDPIDKTFETVRWVSSSIVYHYKIPDSENFKRLPLESGHDLRLKNTNNSCWYYQNNDRDIDVNKPVIIICRNLLITGSIIAPSIEIYADNIICFNNNNYRLMRQLKSNGRIDGDKTVLDAFADPANSFKLKFRYLNLLSKEPGFLKAGHIQLCAFSDVALLGSVMYGQYGINICAGQKLYIETGKEMCKFKKRIYRNINNTIEQSKEIVIQKCRLPHTVIGSQGKVIVSSHKRTQIGLINLILGEFICLTPEAKNNLYTQ